MNGWAQMKQPSHATKEKGLDDVSHPVSALVFTGLAVFTSILLMRNAEVIAIPFGLLGRYCSFAFFKHRESQAHALTLLMVCFCVLICSALLFMTAQSIGSF
jgi:hypothetical protein